VISLSDLTLDARLLRQIDFLAAQYDVVVAAVGRPPPARAVEFVELVPSPLGAGARAGQAAARVALRIAGRYERAYWFDARLRRWRDTLRRLGPVHAVVVNDLWAVPLALDAAWDAPVIFDSHEHWTSESASWTRPQRLSMRGAHEWIVDHHVPRTAAMMTVSRGIARAYERRVGVLPELITNAPFYRPLAPTAVREPIRLLHVGLADERRRLEDTIDAVRSLGDRFVLDLVLARENAYRRHIERLVAAEDGIRVLPPIPTAELISFANHYDVGVFLLPAIFPNQVHVLPNKLFDYIQARLAVAIGPSAEMAAIVREWDCGVVSESFSPGAFAEALGRLDAQSVAHMKVNADRAARVLNADRNRVAVLSLVKSAIRAG
jgi:glycosyltransferase involved in cell wall biosynthesis